MTLSLTAKQSDQLRSGSGCTNISAQADFNCQQGQMISLCDPNECLGRDHGIQSI